MNNRRNKSDFFSWFVIILLFASGFWPIALFLLIRKLFYSDVSKTERERREAPSLTKEETIRQQEAELERLRKKVQQKAMSYKAKETIRSIIQSPKENDRSAAILTIAGALVKTGALKRISLNLLRVFFRRGGFGGREEPLSHARHGAWLCAGRRMHARKRHHDEARPAALRLLSRHHRPERRDGDRNGREEGRSEAEAGGA